MSPRTVPITEEMDWAKLLEHAMIELPSERLAAMFLGSSQYVGATGKSMNQAHTRLLLGCIGAFVEHLGGSCVWITAFACDGNNRPCYLARPDDAQGEAVLGQGTMFIQLPGANVVVTVERDSPTTRTLTVVSSSGSDGFLKAWTSFARQNNPLRGQWIYPSGQVLEKQRRCNWEDIVVSDGIRTMLDRQVRTFFDEAQWLRTHGIKSRRGIILHGPPGTGKSLLCRVLASQVSATCIWCTPQDLDHPSEVQEVMFLARFLAPTILFLEDLDLFASERGGGENRVLGELMNQMDGLERNHGLVTIATTNRLEVIEKALQSRPGRFDRVIEVPTLDASCRQQLLRRLLRSVELSHEDMMATVQGTEGMSGAQIEEVVASAFLAAATDPTRDDGNTIAEGLADAIAELGCGCRKAIGFH